MARKMTKKEEYFRKEKELIGSSTVNYGGPVLTGGEGVYGFDLDGKKFLDFTGQISLLNTGYVPKEVVSALKQMAGKLPACISADYPYSVEITVNKKEKRNFPSGFGRTIDCDYFKSNAFSKKACVF